MKQLIEAIEAKFADVKQAFQKGLITEEEFTAKMNGIRDEVANGSLNRTHKELTEFDLAFERVELAKLAASEARKALVALLPEASVNHMTEILRCIADGRSIPFGYRPNVDVRLNETQTKEVERARKERVEFLTRWWSQDHESVVAELRQAGALTSYVVKVGDKATTTTAKWTQTHGTKPVASKTSAAGVAVANAARIAAGL